MPVVKKQLINFAIVGEMTGVATRSTRSGRAGQGRDNENSLWAPGIHGPVKKLKIEKN